MVGGLENPAVLCWSGGMDSTSLLYHLLANNHTVVALSFDYGQRHRHELFCVDQQLAYLERNGLSVQHQRVDLSRFGSGLASALTEEATPVPLGHYAELTMKQTVVPNRNAIFFSLAAAQALTIADRAGQVAQLSLAVHSGDHAIYPDCRPEFYRAMWNAFQLGNWDADRVALYLPYLEWDKADILRDAERSIEALGLDFDFVFSRTSTSYLPDESGRAHGLTGSDVERVLAFHEIQRVDPIDYQKPWEEVVEQAIEMHRQHLSQ